MATGVQLGCSWVQLGCNWVQLEAQATRMLLVLLVMGATGMQLGKQLGVQLGCNWVLLGSYWGLLGTVGYVKSSFWVRDFV